MLILTATATGQGDRDNDYNWAIEGELVWLGLVCARDRRDPDGGCGCGRGFSGLNSHRATTTAMVRDLSMSREDVLDALVGYLDSAGYGRFAPEELGGDVDEMLSWTQQLSPGDIVERRLDELRVRIRR
jgi:hypothetical protein